MDMRFPRSETNRNPAASGFGKPGLENKNVINDLHPDRSGKPLPIKDGTGYHRNSQESREIIGPASGKSHGQGDRRGTGPQAPFVRGTGGGGIRCCPVLLLCAGTNVPRAYPWRNGAGPILGFFFAGIGHISLCSHEIDKMNDRWKFGKHRGWNLCGMSA